MLIVRALIQFFLAPILGWLSRRAIHAIEKRERLEELEKINEALREKVEKAESPEDLKRAAKSLIDHF